ncbi:MAG: hypothetical protein KDJ80_12410 [Nitratireductor sp.]|nr:hypothetical protein [Nitratireductor sp.]
MLANIPLMIIPFIVYNVIALTISATAGGNDVWQNEMFSIGMLSGATWVMTLGELMITLALLLLFAEIIKSTRIGASSIVDHLLSTFVFIAFLVEFLLVRSAVHSVFFILMMIALVDVVSGFSVSIRSATRDVSIGDRF